MSAVYGKEANMMNKEQIEEDTRVTQYLGKDQKLVETDVRFHSDSVTRHTVFYAYCILVA